MFPIEQIKSEFLTALCASKDANVVVLTAPPGAGKSTVLPLWLLDEAFAQNSRHSDSSNVQKIYLLQPRRVAAKNIACYLAKQLGEPVGQTIGYRLRNESKVSKQTRLEVITEGILTQLLQQDPELSQSSLILFDEFHERSIQADLAFALARDCQLGLRDDLTLVLMSATLANEFIRTKLPGAQFIESEGRSYPVEVSYQPLKGQDFWRDHATRVICQQALKHQGSTLVFLPGVADIKAIAEKVEAQLDKEGYGIATTSRYVVAPLYGELSLSEQQRAISPVSAEGTHKIVLATNVAETSLTIEGISLVIDAGFEKVAIYDNQTLTNQLQQKPISKASAIQRAGRSGRLGPGQCIRLYSEEDFNRRQEQAVSDIQQTDLLPVLIEAARWGVKALTDLPMIELPNQVKETLAWQELQQLSIVDEKNKLTQHGVQLAKLSCHPRYAHMIVSAKNIEKEAEQEYGATHLVNLACLLAALLEERDIFNRQQGQSNSDMGLRADYLVEQVTSGKKLHGKQANIIKQAKHLAKQLEVDWQPIIDRQYCGALLALAYPERIAKRRKNSTSFIAANGKGLELDEADALVESDYIVAANTLLLRDKQTRDKQLRGKQLISLAAPVDINLLNSWQIAQISEGDYLNYDEQKDAIVSEKRSTLGQIVISSTPTQKSLNQELITDMWVSMVRQKGIEWLRLSEACQQLLKRINWLARYQPSLEFPTIDNDWLLLNLDSWFAPFVGDVTKKSKLLALDYKTMLNSVLDYIQQRQLSKCTPEYYIGPTGRKCPIIYGDMQSPKVSLPMQEVYGQAASPQVGDVEHGQGVALTLELLSPAGRPIQLTSDLAGFWQGSYSDVQKEMKGRYPKHYWPDDPANAQATNKTKRFIKT